MKDVKGTYFFKKFCEPELDSGWIDYYWPKPNKQVASRKISYIKQVSNSNLRVGGGLYEDLLTVDELTGFTREMLELGQVKLPK